MDSAFQWLNGHIIDENRVTFHVGKIHMGVGHVQGGVAMACVEIATCSVLNKYFDDNNYNLIVKSPSPVTNLTSASFLSHLFFLLSIGTLLLLCNLNFFLCF